jgi:hypothetical protein
LEPRSSVYWGSEIEWLRNFSAERYEDAVEESINHGKSISFSSKWDLFM